MKLTTKEIAVFAMLGSLMFGSKLAKKFELVKLIRYSLILGSFLYISLFVVHIFVNINPWVYMIWSGVAMGVASGSIYFNGD